MTDILEISGIETRTFEINGENLKLRRLRLKELFPYFEQMAIDRYIAEAIAFSKKMDKEDGRLFVKEAFENIPRDLKLATMASQIVASTDGLVHIIYLASRDYCDKGIEFIKDLVEFQKLENIAEIFSFCTGIEQDESNGEVGVVEDSGKKK